jgi:hypothetical protein
MIEVSGSIESARPSRMAVRLKTLILPAAGRAGGHCAAIGSLEW